MHFFSKQKTWQLFDISQPSGLNLESWNITLFFTSHMAGWAYMITGSEDAKIHLWDLGKIGRMTVLSGLETNHEYE